MKRAVVAFAGLGLLLAACGGGGSANAVASLENTAGGSAGTTVTTVAMSEEETMMAFTECLRDHGLEVEDPTVDADGNVQLSRPQALADGQGDPEAFRAAFDACSDLLQGVTLGFGRRDDTEFQDTLFEYAACMRDNGYDMPDPDFTSGGPGTTAEGDAGDGPRFGGPFGEIDPNDPAYQTANEACSDILAGFGPGGGAGGFPGGPPDGGAPPGGGGTSGGGGNG